MGDHDRHRQGRPRPRQVDHVHGRRAATGNDQHGRRHEPRDVHQERVQARRRAISSATPNARSASRRWCRRSVMTLTGDTGYHTEMRATYDPPFMGMKESQTASTASTSAPCRDGIVPGDFVMPGGQKFNIKGIATGKTPADAVSATRTPRKGPAMSHNLFDTLQGVQPRVRRHRHVLFAARAGESGGRQGIAPAGVDPHRARVGAAQLRRQEGHARSTSGSSPIGAPTAARVDEIPFVVARVVLQDFTGVPLLADLAAMRNVANDLGQEPEDDRAAGARSTSSSTTR